MRWSSDPPAKISDNAMRVLSRCINEQCESRPLSRWLIRLALLTLAYAIAMIPVLLLAFWATGLITEQMIKEALGR